MTSAKRTAAGGAYFEAVAATRASGGATAERSYYPALENLLNAIGDTLEPRVRCVTELKDVGGGHPDMGLYSARQLRKGEDRPLPERGVVEVKAPDADALKTAAGAQVRRYRGLYGLVLVTNLREFLYRALRSTQTVTGHTRCLKVSTSTTRSSTAWEPTSSRQSTPTASSRSGAR